MADIIQHIEHEIALVAVREGAVVGCARAVRGADAFVIRGLLVDPAWQGQGVGSALLKALEAAISAPARIDLTTNTVMEGNVPFYERHGYRLMATTAPIPGITLAHLSKSVAGAG